MGDRCKISPFNTFMEDSNGVLVFNALTGALVLLETSAATRLAEGGVVDPELQSDLLSGGFLEQGENSQLAELRDSYLSWARSDSTLSLTLAPTLACNFVCSYCFQKGLKVRRAMSEATESQILDFVGCLLPQKHRLSVIWFGGEPLLAWRTIERLTIEFLKRCRQDNIQYDAALVTNGYLLTEDKALELQRLQIRRVQVTLDGPASIHDRRRPTKKGEPTFGQILSNLVALKENNSLVVHIRINIDKENAGAAQELLAVLASRGFAHRENVKLAFAPVKNEPSIGDGSCTVDSEYQLWQSILQKKAQRIGLVGGWRPTPRVGSCGASHPFSFAIDPGGAIYKCWETIGVPETAIGHVSNPSGIDQKHWLSFDPFSGKCAECAVLPLCMGGCPLPKVMNGNQAVDPSWCQLVRSGLEQWIISVTGQKT